MNQLYKKHFYTSFYYIFMYYFFDVLTCLLYHTFHYIRSVCMTYEISSRIPQAYSVRARTRVFIPLTQARMNASSTIVYVMELCDNHLS